jgi:hypothetical protein
MKNYMILAAGVVFLCTFIGFIIPEGKLNKAVCFVIRIVCIAILVEPLTAILHLNVQDSQSEYYIDYDYIAQQYSANQQLALKGILDEQFNIDASCEILINYDGQNFVQSTVCVNYLNEEEDTNMQIYEYLQALGYIDITVNEKSY